MLRPFNFSRVCNRIVHGLAALTATACLSACQYLAPPELYESRSIAIAPDPVGVDTKARTGLLSVAIYNVEGLAWPAKTGRTNDLRRIGAALAQWRADGRGPDVVMLQEVFSREAIAIARHAGYANTLPGPSRRDRREIAAADVPREFRKARRRFKGERLGKRTSSGLYILTDLPVLMHSSQPFSRRACAGFDCLANKGLMQARILVPANGAMVDLFNAHFNSRGSSGVRRPRADRAHAFQIMESAEFVGHTHEPSLPIIYGGDFNTAGTRTRFDALHEGQDMMIAHERCTANAPSCDVRISADGDEPWRDTPDLQFFEHGRDWHLVPIRIESLFDGGAQPALSDHDGFMVTYAVMPVRSMVGVDE